MHEVLLVFNEYKYQPKKRGWLIWILHWRSGTVPCDRLHTIGDIIIHLN